MPNVKMGFEGQIFRGTAGSTAATQLTNVKDITYNITIETGDTTVRGDGTTVPIQTGSITLRQVSSLEFTMIHDTTDSDFTALQTAATGGTSVAIRTKSYSSGTGFDGDCYVTFERGMPLAGEQTVKFVCTPTRDDGRTPSLNA